MISQFISFNSDKYSLYRINSFLDVVKKIRNLKTKDLAHSQVRYLLNGIPLESAERVNDLKDIFDKLGKCFQDNQYLDLKEILIDKLPNSLRNTLSRKYIEPIFDKLYQNDTSSRSFAKFYNYLDKPIKEKLEFLIANVDKLPQGVFKDILLSIDLGNLTDQDFTEIERRIWDRLDSLSGE